MKHVYVTYSDDASVFLSERIDEDSNYINATTIFEQIISKNVKEGILLIKLLPLPPRCFIVKIPLLKELAFFYWHGISENKVNVEVFAIDFV